MKYLRMMLSFIESSDRKTVGLLVGLVMGILYLFVGFWKVIVFGFFVGAGYAIGRLLERREDWRDVIDRVWSNYTRD